MPARWPNIAPQRSNSVSHTTEFSNLVRLRPPWGSNHGFMQPLVSRGAYIHSVSNKNKCHLHRYVGKQPMLNRFPILLQKAAVWEAHLFELITQDALTQIIDEAMVQLFHRRKHITGSTYDVTLSPAASNELRIFIKLTTLATKCSVKAYYLQVMQRIQHVMNPELRKGSRDSVHLCTRNPGTFS